MQMKEKKGFEVSDYIIVQERRFFIDIAKKGCGSGCAYCYVSSKDESQVLLNQEQIKQICIYLQKHYECRGRIISLCPNTEPLKSDASRKLVLYIIRFFLKCGSYIQISTKESIPDEFLRKIDSIAKRRVYFNISIPFLKNTSEIEPFAGNIVDRFENFSYAKRYSNICFCLYIKPFTKHAYQYCQLYIDMINKYHIDTVFVGVQFDYQLDQPCQSLYIEDKATELLTKQKENICLLIHKLRNETNALVFGSSICRIHNDFNIPCSLMMFKYDKVFCSACNHCKGAL